MYLTPPPIDTEELQQAVSHLKWDSSLDALEEADANVLALLCLDPPLLYTYLPDADALEDAPLETASAAARPSGGVIGLVAWLFRNRMTKSLLHVLDTRERPVDGAYFSATDKYHGRLEHPVDTLLSAAIDRMGLRLQDTFYTEAGYADSIDFDPSPLVNPYLELAFGLLQRGARVEGGQVDGGDNPARNTGAGMAVPRALTSAWSAMLKVTGKTRDLIEPLFWAVVQASPPSAVLHLLVDFMPRKTFGDDERGYWARIVAKLQDFAPEVWEPDNALKIIKQHWVHPQRLAVFLAAGLPVLDCRMKRFVSTGETTCEWVECSLEEAIGSLDNIDFPPDVLALLRHRMLVEHAERLSGPQGTTSAQPKANVLQRVGLSF